MVDCRGLLEHDGSVRRHTFGHMLSVCSDRFCYWTQETLVISKCCYITDNKSVTISTTTQEAHILI